MDKNEVMKITALEDTQGDIYFQCIMNDGDRQIIKKLSYTGFMKMMENSYREEGVSLSVGQLPDYYIDAKVSSGGRNMVRVYIPAQVRPFYLANGDRPADSYIIPFPPMLLEVGYGTGYSSGNLTCVKGSYEEVKEAYYNGSLELYRYPFGNVANDGHVCMGNMRVEMKKATDVSEYISRFFDSITNHDYVGNGVVTKKGHTQGTLVGALNGKAIFPLEWLISTKDNAKPY